MINTSSFAEIGAQLQAPVLSPKRRNYPTLESTVHTVGKPHSDSFRKYFCQLRKVNLTFIVPCWYEVLTTASRNRAAPTVLSLGEVVEWTDFGK